MVFGRKIKKIEPIESDSVDDTIADEGQTQDCRSRI